MTQWEDGSCRGAREKRLTWGKGGEQKHRPAQRTWLVLVPALTRWQWRAQQRGCAWLGGLEQPKHAKCPATQADKPTQIQFPAGRCKCSVHAQEAQRVLQPGQGRAALLQKEPISFFLVKINGFVIDTLLFFFLHHQVSGDYICTSKTQLNNPAISTTAKKNLGKD